MKFFLSFYCCLFQDSVELCKGIYCRSKDITNALNGADMRHVIRRLMPGVFVPSKILNCTYTGRAPTAAGKDSIKQEDLDCLHPNAMAAIISEYFSCLHTSREVCSKINNMNLFFNNFFYF